MELKLNILFGMLLLMVMSCSKSNNFKIILLPDTQTLVEEYPEVYNAQMKWIAEYSTDYQFVIHQGDITQNNNDEEWQIAKKGFQLLNGKIPFTFSLGNHDMGSADGKFADVRNTTFANSYFSVEELTKNCNLVASFPKNTVDNLCHSFSVGFEKWLVISLEFGPRNKTLAWANSLINKYPDYKVIINTHAYLFEDNTLMDGNDWWQPQAYGVGNDVGDDAVNNGGQIWEKLVSKHKNIVFVFSGHVLKSGVGTLVGVGNHGNNVYQMLANYQKNAGEMVGNEGYLRIVSVNYKEKRIDVKTYSPYLDKYINSPDHNFNFTNVDL